MENANGKWQRFGLQRSRWKLLNDHSSLLPALLMLFHLRIPVNIYTSGVNPLLERLINLMNFKSFTRIVSILAKNYVNLA